MPFPFKGALETIFQLVLKLFRMAPVSDYVEARLLFESSNTIMAYYEVLIREYDKCGTQRMEELCVKEVQLCKMQRGPQHEYISAKISGPNNLSFYLVFERFRGGKNRTENESSPDSAADTTLSASNADPCALPSASLDSQTTNPRIGFILSGIPHMDSIPTDSQQSLDSLSPSRNADDRVAYISSSHDGRYNQTDKIYRSLTFSTDPNIGRPLYLYELVVLANTLHKIERRYLLGSKQCYFYAGTIIQVLQEVYGPGLTVYTTGSNETDQANEVHPKKPRKDDKAGKCKMIPIYANLSSPSDMGYICRSFEEETANFKSQVSTSSPNILLAANMLTTLFRLRAHRIRKKVNNKQKPRWRARDKRMLPS